MQAGLFVARLPSFLKRRAGPQENGGKKLRKSFLLAAVLLGLLTAPGGALAAPCVEGEALVVFKKAPGAVVTLSASQEVAR